MNPLSLNQRTYSELLEAFCSAMNNAPFDTVWDKLYRAYEVSWYSHPDDARDCARRLFENNVDDIRKMASNRYWVTTGCIKLEFTNTPEKVECEIGWVCCDFGRNYD
jgi:hypothetical protein